MVKKTVHIKLKSGLQARPATQFVNEANRYSSEIFIEKENKKINAKSIMGIMSLALSSGTNITILADGKDEKEAVESLAELVSGKGD